MDITPGNDFQMVQPLASLPLASAVAVPQSVTGTTEAGDFFDSVTVIDTTTSSFNNWQITGAFGATLSNLTPEVASLDANGLLTRITDGPAQVKSSNAGGFSILTLSMTAIGGAVVTTFDGYANATVPGILADDMIDLWDSGGTLPLFTTINHSASIYAKSLTCWAKDLELSGLAVALATNGSNWNQANAPVAVSSQHAVIVRHFQTCTKGVSKARFRGNDGTIHERTIIGISAPLKSGSLADDLIVVTFDSALPASVVPFELAGDWIRQGVTDSGENRQYPGEAYAGGFGFSINQEYHALGMLIGQPLSKFGSSVIRDITYNGESMDDVIGSISISSGESARYGAFDFLEPYTEFLSNIETGDSGKPTFVVIGDEPVLVCLFTYVNLGPLIGVNNGSVVNAMIVNADSSGSVSTGLTVSIAPDPSA